MKLAIILKLIILLVKKKLIKHFFKVRSYAKCNISQCKKRKTIYGTDSNKK